MSGPNLGYSQSNFFDLLDEYENPSEDSCTSALRHVKSLFPVSIPLPFRPKLLLSHDSSISYISNQGQIIRQRNKELGEFKLKLEVSCITASNNFQYLFCGDKQGNVHKILYASLERQGSAKIHSEKIRNICVSREYVYTADSERVMESIDDKAKEVGKYEFPCIDACDGGIFIADRRGVLQSPKMQKKTEYCASAVKVSENIAVVGCVTGEIVVLNLDNLENMYTLASLNQFITCVAIGDRNRVAVGTKNGIILMWSYSSSQVSIEISEEQEKITAVLLGPTKILACIKRKPCKTWNTQQSSELKVLPQESNITDILVTDKYLVLSLGESVLFYSKENLLISTTIYPGLLRIANNKTYIGILTSTKIILQSLFNFQTRVFEDKSFSQLALTENYLVASDRSEIYCYSIKSPGIEGRFHTSDSKCIIWSHDDQIIISAKEIVSITANPANQNDKNEVVMDGSWGASLFLATKDYVIGATDVLFVWSTLTGHLLHSLKIPTVISVSIFENYLYISTGESIELWDVNCWGKVLILPILTSLLKSSKEFLYYSQNQGLAILSNPLSCSTPLIHGKNPYLFARELQEIISNSIKIHNSELDYHLISPHQITPLHLYAYLNLYTHLEASLCSDACIVPATTQETPLSLASSRGLTQSVDIILKTLCKKIKSNNFALYYTYASLTSLNYSLYKELGHFYGVLLMQNKSRYLPKFADPRRHLPDIFAEEGMEPGKEKYPTSGVAVKYYHSLVLLPTLAGSQSSLDFSRSLAFTLNPDILASDFVEIHLQSKWVQVRNYLYFQAYLYLVYMILLSLYTIYFMNTVSMISVILIVNKVFLVWEVLQMYAAGRHYWEDPWNFIDLSRSALVILYSAIIAANKFPNSQNSLLVVITMLSWIRGINYFRLYEKTRYMVNLIKEVIRDSLSFLLIFFYSTLAFTFIYFAMEDAESDEITDYFVGSYKLNLADYDTSDYTLLEWIVFFAATMINTIIMLNLLIAIFSDTFSKVKENRVIADHKELAQLVYEGEIALFANRKRSEYKYLHVCTDTDFLIEPDVASLKIKSLKKNIKTMQDSINDLSVNHSATASKVDGLYAGMDRLQEAMVRIEQKLTERIE